ncbi:MAG TPA: ATP-binding protein, partial [bacterium]|nr:ATP-binding protein [bacterium]
YTPLADPLNQMGKLARKLQDQVVSLRMLPIQPLFARIARVVRDLSQKTGKPVRLELEGGGTYLDKRLVDELWEPMLHLVRNAIDHGMENPGERASKGKNDIGGLWIKAWQQEGQFILSIRDDGKGLDISKIEKKAQALGWLEEGKLLEAAEWQEMIFRPGFSTSDKVSNISGRGIGLDLVRRRLQTLKGTVEMATVPGEGCLFILRVPLTLALLEGLLIRVGGGLYLIPLTQIQRFSLLASGGGGGAHLPSETAVRIDLAEWFGVAGNGSGNPVGIQLEGDKDHLFILVDEILGKREIVLKRLNPLMSNLRWVNGGAILGDGRVALVLDIPSLVRELSRVVQSGEFPVTARAGEGAA